MQLRVRSAQKSANPFYRNQLRV